MESARAKEVKVRESSERERRDMRSGMAESAWGGAGRETNAARRSGAARGVARRLAGQKRDAGTDASGGGEAGREVMSCQV